MIDLTLHKRFRYILFSSLYFAEGLYQIMLVVIVPLYLFDKNVSIPIITLVMAIGELPWGLKFIWGGIIDFYHKFGRKKFTILGTIIGAIAFLIIALIDQFFSIIFFTLFLFLGHVGIGFLDASTDAWAIDITEKKERGKINASMVSGRMIGYSVFGLIFVLMSVNFGYNISFIINALIIFVIAAIVSMVKYSDVKITRVNIWPEIKNEFRKKPTQLTTLFLFFATLNPGIFLSIIVLYSKTVLNLDELTIGLITAFLILAIIPGSIVGGVISDKYGRKKPLILFLIIVCISSIGFMFAYNLLILIILLIIFDFAWNAAISINWALAMDITNPEVGASELSIIYSISNLGDVGAGAIAGTLVVIMGFQNVFLLSGILIIPAILTLYKLKINGIKN